MKAQLNHAIKRRSGANPLVEYENNCHSSYSLKTTAIVVILRIDAIEQTIALKINGNSAATKIGVKHIYL